MAWAQEDVRKADERAAAAKSRRNEVFARLSSMADAQRERDEAVAHCDEDWHQWTFDSAYS